MRTPLESIVHVVASNNAGAVFKATPSLVIAPVQVALLAGRVPVKPEPEMVPVAPRPPWFGVRTKLD